MKIVGAILTIMLGIIPLLPPFFIIAVAFVFGIIIGSFLNVFIYRFHTGKSLSGNSHCLSCRIPLRFYELFPLVSYLGLRGRCRTCSSFIPSRYFWVELTTGLLFVAVVTQIVDIYLWPLLLLLVATLVVISVYDLAHFIIPNSFVWFLVGIAIAYNGYVVYETGQYVTIVGNLGAGLIAFSFFAGLWWYSGGRWIGFGDAKLAAPLASMVGMTGVFSMLTLAFWTGTLISVGIIVVQKLHKRGQLRYRFSAPTLTIKSEVPFAPFIVIGFILVFLLKYDVLLWFSYAL